MSIATQAGRSVARFQLLRELGRGAQATVWLAHDPRLDREVAVKLLSLTADTVAVSQWLHEARSVSRLAHPNIVPVFEADEAHGQPYLVFEYVQGPTLAQANRQRKAWPAREAVGLMLCVLDALTAAHAQGIVHRDLKPSNVLLGGDGRARVMDFGIAARLCGKASVDGDGVIVGTPGYMSPEAARGEAPAASMDVFAAGIMLGEMLSGARLNHESDPLRAIARVQNIDLALPAEPQIDDTLRGIVQRALARDSAARYDSAAALHAALSNWLKPLDNPAADAAQASATLEFLLRRMRHKTDFPALSAAVVRIQRSATSDTESLGSLAQEVLKDVALTNKLLRMVNTAHFSQAAGGGVATVTRAVALVGFAGIRNMALSVILLEHMSDRAHASLIKHEFLRALMSGTLAGELSAQSKQGEEAFIGAMFQNLGRLLTEYYFPEEALQIRQQLTAKDMSPAARELAAKRVLGLSFDELGLGIARAWGLPEALQQAMRAPVGELPTRKIESASEHQRWVGRSAAALTDCLLEHEVPVQQQALLAVAGQFGPALGLKPRDMLAAAQRARTRLAQMAQAMGVHVAPDLPARRLLEDPARDARPSLTSDPQATVRLDAASALRPAVLPHSVTEQLQQGLDEIRRAQAVGGLGLNDALQSVLNVMHRALDLRCVVLALRDARSGSITGRLGLGAQGRELAAAFVASPAKTGNADLFSALCAKGADTLIADAGTSKIAARLPAWYRKSFDAQTFLLLPLVQKGATFGLIYADKSQAGSLVLADPDMALIRALRDQLVAALVRGGR